MAPQIWLFHMSWVYALISSGSYCASLQQIRAKDDITGCPIFGCNPGGSFSFQLQLPATVRLLWESRVSLRTLPKTLGCVGNNAAIVCPVITNSSVGYGAFTVEDGNVTWIDRILQHPPLPLMDIYGDIIGSDGQKLLQYRADGSVLRPVIQLFPPLRDIFSLNLANNGIFLITSSHGVVTTYFTNGVPGGRMTLRYRVKNESGIFRPITTPVIQGHRTYILTSFKSHNASAQSNGLLRLFAVDLNDQFVGKIKVAWFMDFRQSPDLELSSCVGERPFKGSAAVNGSVLVYKDLVFVTIPLPWNNSLINASDFWVIHDNGKQGFIKYNGSWNIDDLSVFDISPVNELYKKDKNYATFKTGLLSLRLRKLREEAFQKQGRHVRDINQKLKSGRPLLWGSIKNQGMIIGFDLTGGDIKFVTKLDLRSSLKAEVKITSKLMTVRNQTETADSLLFGIHIENKTENFANILKHYKCEETNNSNYLVAVKVTKGNSPVASLLWLTPVPGDGVVEGQIVGFTSNTHNNYKVDRGISLDIGIIVAYAVGTNSSAIFAVGLS